MSDGYDPDKIQKILDNMTADEFGRRIAKQIVKKPYSSNWALVNFACEDIDSFGLEHAQVQALVERIADDRQPKG